MVPLAAHDVFPKTCRHPNNLVLSRAQGGHGPGPARPSAVSAARTRNYGPRHGAVPPLRLQPQQFNLNFSSGKEEKARVDAFRVRS